MINLYENQELKKDIMSILKIRHDIASVETEDEKSKDAPIIAVEETDNDGGKIRYHIDVDIPYEIIQYTNIDIEKFSLETLSRISERVIDYLELLVLNLAMSSTDVELNQCQFLFGGETATMTAKVTSSDDNILYDTITCEFNDIDLDKYPTLDDDCFKIEFGTSRHFRHMFGLIKEFGDVSVDKFFEKNKVLIK